MHPAFSVIFFTTASGAGFGTLAWLGMLALSGNLPPRMTTLVALAIGAGLAAAGLLSSLGHLGQPKRAWRAFSQWRSSWLSREGVFATATFAPALWLAWICWQGQADAAGSARVAGALLALLALGSVVCTAMIYASLKPIPAWTHPLVLPVYLSFALYSGGIVVATCIVLGGGALAHLAGFGVCAGAAMLAALKAGAWRHVDNDRAPISRNSALGLPHARPVHVFERPHTEANYLLREMGYVLARRHARRLRAISVLLFAALPALVGLSLWLLPGLGGSTFMLPAALLSVLAGALVERWLFFAEARHLVTLYY
jgi:DMSO reductase anchor subunit